MMEKSFNLVENEELNSIVPTTSKEVLLCGFVDFPKIVNYYREYECYFHKKFLIPYYLILLHY